jgi:hypothetical protein
VAGRERAAQLGRDPSTQRVVEFRALAQDDEQQQLARAGRIVEVHDQAVGDLGKRLDDRVELARAEADTAAIERCVRTAGDHTRTVLVDRDPVAVAPHTGVLLEVGGAVPAAVVVGPEADRHRRHGRGDDQLAHVADDGLALFVERRDGRTEVAARDLACAHGQEGCHADERGAHVGPTADRAEHEVVTDGLVDPSEALGRQWRAGGADTADRRQVHLVGRAQALLPAVEDERRARAEVRDPFVGGEPPQGEEVGRGGIAVEAHHRRSREQPRHEEVPHHPSGGREPEEDIGRAEVAVERDRLHVLERDAAVAVHDRLRQAGRAGRVEDVERMVERHGVGDEGACVRGELGPRRRPLDGGVRVEVRDDDGVRQRRQRVPDRAGLVAAIDCRGPVSVPVDREQDLRLDLAEPIHDRTDAELGRARRPDGAEARRREERDDRLRDVR